MADIRTEPCNWPLAYCGEPPTTVGDIGQCPALKSLSVDMADLIERMAVSYLWNWTKRQFGTCPVTIRPCRDTCLEAWATYRGRGYNNYLPSIEGGGWGGPFIPALINGQWFNFGCGGSCNTDLCSCTYVPTITLAGPVAGITEVKQAGVVLDPSAYRLDNHRYLVRTDGKDWPTCQDMVEDPSVVGSNTMTITYEIGTTVPAGGQVAAGVLACQFAKAACSDDSCKLPQRLKSLTRQNVQMEFLDNYQSMYEYGTTGLFIVDSWVASILAANRVSGMRIANPDKRPPRRTT